MPFDQDEEKGHAEMQAAMDVRDREREKIAVDAFYRRRAEASLRDLCLQDFPLY